MKKLATISILVLLSVLSMTVNAGECVLKIQREACPGKEAAAFKPYDGKSETEEKKTTADAKACTAEAEKAAKIVRKGTLSAKKVTSTFDKKPLEEKSDKADCK